MHTSNLSHEWLKMNHNRIVRTVAHQQFYTLIICVPVLLHIRIFKYTSYIDDSKPAMILF